MRIFFIVFFISAGLTAIAQTDSIELKQAMERLDKAIIAKDMAALDKLLHKDVTYGHSSGLTQSKAEIQNDLQSGKMVYTKIENTSVKIVAIHKDWASVRTNTSAEGSLNQNPFKLTLQILQVWIKTKDGWKLVARQSVKLS